jgi:hypothetical protein
VVVETGVGPVTSRFQFATAVSASDRGVVYRWGGISPATVEPHPLMQDAPGRELGGPRRWRELIVAIAGVAAVLVSAGTSAHASLPGPIGKIAYVGPDRSSGGGGEALIVMDPSGANAQVLDERTGSIGRPSWSPDGSQLAYRGTDLFGSGGLYVISLNDRSRRQLPFDGVGPAWSPDGARLAYKGGSGIELINVDGTGKRTLLVANDGRWSDPSWSPDGANLAIDGGDNGPAVYTLNISTGSVVRISDPGSGADALPDWSPDGRSIAYSHWVANPDGSAAAEVRIFDVATGATRTIARCTNTCGPSWSPDGSRIIYSGRTPPDNVSGPEQIVSVRADGSDPVYLTGADQPIDIMAWGPRTSPVGSTGTSSTTKPTFTTTTTTSPRPSTTSTTSTTSTPSATSPAAPKKRSGYWLLEQAGTVHAFGDAPSLGSPATSDAVDIVGTATGRGYYVLTRTGFVLPFGDATFAGDLRNALRPGERAVSLSANPSGGYWIFSNTGRAAAYGAAPHRGDLSRTRLNGEIVDSVATSGGAGYYMVGSDGGVFTFGNAVFRGSTGNQRLNQPVRALVPDPDNLGYWLVAADGGVFAFDAPFFGSMGGTTLNAPITGMTGFAGGYLIVARDGGVFTFGEALFSGSLGDNPPPSPVVSLAPLAT